MEMRQFITFFKCKITMDALKYPKLVGDLIEPAQSDNGINLLTIILTFCLRPETVVRMFVNPNSTPRQFDVSDLIPHIVDADLNYRLEMPMKKGSLSDLESEDDEKEEESESEAEEDQQTEKVKREPKQAIQKKQNIGHELQSKNGKKESKKRRHSPNGKSIQSKQKKPNLSIEGSSADRPIELDELEDDQDDQLEEEQEIGEQTEEIREVEVKQSYTSVSSFVSTTIDKKEVATVHKKPSFATKKEPKRNDVFSPIAKSIELPTANTSEESEPESESETESELELATTPTKTLKDLFQRKLSRSFRDILQMSTFISCKDPIDIILEAIEIWTHNSLTNANVKGDDSDMHRWPIVTRENLIVDFTRKTKREFDEDEFEELLLVDHPNEIFPLFFETNTIFLVNFQTKKDSSKVVVNIIVISTRTRSEKEIMKNYAFKRLVEMYVWKYKRLVTRINTSIITVPTGSPYELFMVALYCIHQFTIKGKFDVKISPQMNLFEKYMDNFEMLMQGINERNGEMRDSSFKALIAGLSHPTAKA